MPNNRTVEKLRTVNIAPLSSVGIPKPTENIPFYNAAIKLLGSVGISIKLTQQEDARINITPSGEKSTTRMKIENLTAGRQPDDLRSFFEVVDAGLAAQYNPEFRRGNKISQQQLIDTRMKAAVEKVQKRGYTPPNLII